MNTEFAVRFPVENMCNTRLEVTHLRDNRYAVRPDGQLGTCGWFPFSWTVVYVRARNPAAAVDKARAQAILLAIINPEVQS